jgi:hypothetical protein
VPSALNCSVDKMASDVKALCEVKCQPHFSRYVSYQENSEGIRPNQDASPEGLTEPDLRVNILYRRRGVDSPAIRPCLCWG